MASKQSPFIGSLPEASFAFHDIPEYPTSLREIHQCFNRDSDINYKAQKLEIFFGESFLRKGSKAGRQPMPAQVRGIIGRLSHPVSGKNTNKPSLVLEEHYYNTRRFSQAHWQSGAKGRLHWTRPFN
jgi:hypothetical protein